MEEQKSGNGAMLWVVAIVVIALIAFGGYKYMNKTVPVAVDTTTTTTTTTDTTTPPPVTSSVYKDGTYSSVGTYMAPSGQESIGVSMTLAGDVVKDVSVTSNATNSDSKKYQQKFISGYKTMVVGKKISDISLSKVSGSSLTPNGFNDAIAKIAVQAKA
jgi:hypothetical protein